METLSLLTRSNYRWLFCFLCLALLVGCQKKKEIAPVKISEKNRSGTQYAKLTEKVKIQFTATGKQQRTLLGGKETPPAANAKLQIKLSKQPEGANGTIALEDSEGIPGQLIETRTNAGGTVDVILALGSRPGIYVVEASVPGSKVKKKLVFLGGVAITNAKQDGWVNNKLEHPICIQIEESPGIYTKAANIEALAKNVPKKTKVMAEKDTTNEKGEYELKIGVKTGSVQGKGIISIRVFESALGPEAARHPIDLQFFAVDRWKLFIGLLGGLAVFIFGMKLMSEGLSLTAGDKLRGLLNSVTRNRLAAAGAGLVTTGLIQSSSACTVMVIGFVNAGLMQLEQAIGVIMGANIGTTVTAQMISFKLTNLALPAIIIGVVMALLAKQSKTKFLAQILIGFGLLFYGMKMLSSPLKELKDAEMLKSLFTSISCNPDDGGMTLVAVFLAVGVGTLITVIVQSSSASIGLLLALASLGLVDPYTAFAILCGTNIGTTITAILASIGTSAAAKRAACAHCLFNIAGTVIMVALLFVAWPGTNHPVFMELVSKITDGDNFAGDNITRFLANCHTMFNISCAILFIGFINVFAFLCRRIVPGDEPIQATSRKSFLEPHLLATPSIAIQQAWAELGFMVNLARQVHDKSFHAIGKAQADLDLVSDEAKAEEAQLDRLQNTITDYISEVSRETLTEDQGEMLPHILHSVNDAERLGDHSINFLRLAKRVSKRELPFSDQAKEDLHTMFMMNENLFNQCSNIIAEIAKGEESHDPAIIEEHLTEAYATMRKLKKLESDFYKGHIERQEKGDCDVRSGVIFLEAIRTLLRSGAHIINIIEAASPVKLG